MIRLFLCALSIGCGFWKPIIAQTVDDTGRPGLVIQPNLATVASQFRPEWRIPASYRQHPNGLEIACLHEGFSQMVLKPLEAGKAESKLKVGDIISAIEGRPVRDIGQLFSQLSAGSDQLALTVIDVRNNTAARWHAQPTLVNVPLGSNKEPANGEGSIVMIHAVATKDPQIGPKIAKNIPEMKQLFDSHIAKRYLREYILLKDDDCASIPIAEALHRVQISPQDTLMFYFQGHGAYDPNAADQDPASGQFLDFPREDMWRQMLLRALQAKGARLTVLITDMCNNRSAMDIVPRREFRSKAIPIEGWTGLEELLLCYTGTIDLTSASRGQYAWSSIDIGGWFTNAFVEALAASSSVPADRSWTAVWESTKQKTESVFKKRQQIYGTQFIQLRRQKTMMPQEIIWDMDRDAPKNQPNQSRIITIREGVEVLVTAQ